jgi:hypothetical protein
MQISFLSNNINSHQTPDDQIERWAFLAFKLGQDGGFDGPSASSRIASRGRLGRACRRPSELENWERSLFTNGSEVNGKDLCSVSEI